MSLLARLYWVLLDVYLLRVSGQRQQALYCMKRAAAVDPSDVDLLWEQAMMAKEFGEDEIVSG